MSVSVNYPQRKMLQKLNRSEKPNPVPWWQSALPSIAVLLVTTVVGYVVGVAGERRQQETYEQRLYLEQRMKLFIATATDFNGYLENSERLNTFSAAAASAGGKLTPEEKERGSRYEKDRTAARERLWADLEQAQLFFSAAVTWKIVAFRDFFDKHKNDTLKTMPPKSAEVAHKDAILTAMRDEVKGEKK